MPRIDKIQNDATITGDDKLLGSDVTGATRNYRVQDIANFVANNGAKYKHTQSSSATQWTVTHNLGIENHLPHVTIKSDSGTYNNYEILGDIRYVNKNQLTINFHTAQRGFAFVG